MHKEYHYCSCCKGQGSFLNTKGEWSVCGSCSGWGGWYKEIPDEIDYLARLVKNVTEEENAKTND